MFLNNKKEYYIIIGNNKENGLIINSLGNNKNSETLVLFDNEESNFHSLNCKKYYKTSASSINNFLKKTFKNLKKYHINIIINLNDNTKSIDYVNEIKLLVNELDLDTKTFNVYSFIDVMDYNILDEINSNSNGTINIINKDKAVARNFVSHTPITKYMSEAHLDKLNASINKDVTMNVCILGFGGVNQEIFKAYSSSNLFTTVINNKLLDKKVNYYLYDKDNLENNRYLNQYYYHYEKEFLVNVKRNDYLPLPNIPSNVYLNNCNVYSLEFLKKLKNNLISNDIPYNYIIISLSDDLTNISLGNNIVSKLNEWNLIDYTKVFVYVKENSLYRYMPKNLHYFGNNLEIYNVNNICHNFYKHVSIKRNFIYKIEQMLSSDKDVNEFNTIQEKIDYLRGKEEDIYSNINKEFGNNYLINKESNEYSLLSIRSKLNLLGFDYELQDSSNLSEANDYYKAYERGNLIEYVKDLIYKGKGVINYPIYANKKFEINPRNVLAYNEHNRWNAYMIASGVTPSSINEILISMNEEGEYTNGKDIKNYKHGHLTNYDGLSKFINLVINRDLSDNKGKNQNKNINKDVLLKKYNIFKYDYQLMDDLEYFLSDDNPLYNYVIVSKKYSDCSKYSRIKNNNEAKKDKKVEPVLENKGEENNKASLNVSKENNKSTNEKHKDKKKDTNKESIDNKDKVEETKVNNKDNSNKKENYNEKKESTDKKGDTAIAKVVSDSNNKKPDNKENVNKNSSQKNKGEKPNNENKESVEETNNSQENKCQENKCQENKSQENNSQGKNNNGNKKYYKPYWKNKKKSNNKVS